MIIMNRRFTEDDYDEMARLYKAGGTCREVASEVGASIATISKVLRKRGITLRASGFQRGNRKGNPSAPSPKGMKQCSKCLETKLHAAFNKGQPDSPDGLFYWCRDCQKAYNREYDRTHRKQINKRKRAWRKQNPWRDLARSMVRRDVLRGHQQFPSNEKKAAAVTALANHLKCYPDPDQCGVRGCTNVAVEWDEVRYGEGHTPSNVGRLCLRHNRIKRDALLEDLEGLARYIRGE